MKRETPDRFQRLIGERIRFAREEAHLSQKQLADRLGFKDRQILSNIEAGQRRVSAEELLLFIKELGRSLEFFSDPFLLIGEVVSWRAENYPKLLADFESKLLPVIGLYRHLSADAQEDPQLFVPQLPLTKASYYEDAADAAQRLVEQWNLGKIPSKALAAAAEQRLNLLVMMVDAPREISGAAVFLPQLTTIVVNRNEPLGRRNYDFAHELFHLLTWQSMPPAHLDLETATTKAGGKRIEQLADTFAAALLMPEPSHRAAVGFAKRGGHTRLAEPDGLRLGRYRDCALLALAEPEIPDAGRLNRHSGGTSSMERRWSGGRGEEAKALFAEVCAAPTRWLGQWTRGRTAGHASVELHH